jgi:hypothetical protein
MSSLLSHHNLPRQTIAAFLRGYLHTVPVAPADWAAAESLGLEVGAVVVCLEPVVPLTASADRSEAAESFKVSEAGVVIGKDNERAIVIRITAETYELIFLETLMLSKSQDAKLIDRDFSYLLLEPAVPLSDQQVQEIQQLGHGFARGGSRRERNPESGRLNDPAITLLTALGLKLETLASKQVLDLGLFCQLVFEAGEPPADCPMQDVRAKFRPVPASGNAAGSHSVEPLSSDSEAPLNSFEPDRTPDTPVDDFAQEIDNDQWLSGASASFRESTSQPSFKGLGQLVPGANSDAQKVRREKLKDDLQTLLGLGGIFGDPAKADQSDESPLPAPSPSSKPPAIDWSLPETDETVEPTQQASDFMPEPELPGSGPDLSFLEPEQPAYSDEPRFSDSMLKFSLPEMPPPPPRRATAEVSAPQPDHSGKPLLTPPPPATADTGEIAGPAVDESQTALAPPPPLPPKIKSPSQTAPSTAEANSGPQPKRPTLEIKAPPPLNRPAASPAGPTPRPEAAAPTEAPASAQPKPDLSEAPPAQAERPKLELDEEDEDDYDEDDEEDEDEEDEVTPAARVRTTLQEAPAPGESARSARESRLTKSQPGVGAGMESLVSRLEQQVTKATSNLTAQVDQIHGGLEVEVRKLIEKAARAEQQSESTVKSALQVIIKELEELAEDSRLKVSDAAANGRYAIKQLLETGQKTLDETQKESLNSLLASLTDFKGSSDTLASTIRQRLEGTVSSKTSELSGLVDSICDELDRTNQDFNDRLKSRFERLSDRLAYEGDSTGQALERHVNSLREDLDGLCERAFDKVKSNKNEHEIGLRQFVTMYELKLSQTMNRLGSTVLIPKLREYRESLRSVRAELEKQIASESSEQGRQHLVNLDRAMVELRQQLHQLLNEALLKLEGLGTEQKDRMSKTFKDTSDNVETALERVQSIFTDAEAEIAGNDGTSRKLVEASGAGTNPQVAADKDAAVKNAQQLKEEALNELHCLFDQQCEKLEQSSQNAQTKLSKSKERYARTVSEAAEEAVNLIRKAIQDASQAIKSTQEKYLE